MAALSTNLESRCVCRRGLTTQAKHPSPEKKPSSRNFKNSAAFSKLPTRCSATRVPSPPSGVRAKLNHVSRAGKHLQFTITDCTNPHNLPPTSGQFVRGIYPRPCTPHNPEARANATGLSLPNSVLPTMSETSIPPSPPAGPVARPVSEALLNEKVRSEQQNSQGLT